MNQSPEAVFLIASILATTIASPEFAVAEETPGAQTEAELREVIVSHTDEKGILQLFRMKADGSNSLQLTHSANGCRMPACSPDGEKLVYVQQIDHSLSVWLSGIDGKNARALTCDGMTLLPSWLPDSRHIVWMKAAQPGAEKQDPAANSQIQILDTETGKSRRLFSDTEAIKFSNAMPSISPDGTKVAFVSNRSGVFRVWVSNLDGSDAKLLSPPPVEQNEDLKLPLEQKVPAWSPDGKWIAHWEGVEMILNAFLKWNNKRQFTKSVASRQRSEPSDSDHVFALNPPLTHLPTRRPSAQHNLFSPKRNPPTRGLTEQAQVNRLGFFRGNARSRKGLRIGVSLVEMSLFVARGNGWFRPHVEIGPRMAQTLTCLCRACRSG